RGVGVEARAILSVDQRLPAPDPRGLRNARHRPQEPSLSIREARVRDHRQGGGGSVQEGPRQSAGPRAERRAARRGGQAQVAVGGGGSGRPMRLKGKVALVTGAQQGIGRAIALAFARDGADVGINYLDDRAAAEKATEEVRAAGRRAVLVQADVARVAEAREMVAWVARELGALDILVNNAGVFPRVPLLEMRERDWDLVLDVNLKAGFFCAQAAARVMLDGGDRGSIINLASQAVR